MFFKLIAKNGYRDLIRNARRIVLSDVDDESKLKAFKQLYSVLAPRLLENDSVLNSQTAFASRCAHWNERDIKSIRPVTNLQNPWLRFKREFEESIKEQKDVLTPAPEIVRSVSIALAWFYNTEHREDWLVE